MNLDLAIHRLARRETESLGVAQVLVARKRQELELRLLRQERHDAAATNGAALDRALAAMQRADPSPPSATGARVDHKA